MGLKISMKGWWALGLGLFAAGFWGDVLPAHAESGVTIVLANRNVPESIELARYYMHAREIPDEHLCLLDLPDTEHINREDYEKKLRDPLHAWLKIHDWMVEEEIDGASRPAVTSSRLKYLVSMYGVPLRIADSGMRVSEKIDQALQGSKIDSAAVDSELATLFHPDHELGGMVVNPLFRSELWPPLESSPAQVPLIAARLDGLNPEVVRRMIDGALAGERYGLLGRAYFDLRGTREPGYILGEIWLQEAYHRMLREGYDCVINRSPDLWRSSYPMEDAAFYLGWYAENVTGPFTRSDFRLPAGAVAYHIHSGSAATLRTESRHWVGPLLAKGATASMGAVHEPYLIYTPHLHLFTDHLCRGRSFGESFYLAQSALSWQITPVGDPLYRPFRYSLDEQIAHLEEDQRPEVAWAYLRKVNQMARQGQLNLALDYCRAKIQETGSVVLREKLGDLYAINELYEFATDEYRKVLDSEPSAATAVRCAGRAMWLLNAMSKPGEADAIHQRVRQELAGSEMLFWLAQFDPSAQGE